MNETRPPFEDAPKTCPKCGGEKFRMQHWGKNQRRGRVWNQGEAMVLHICRGCSWPKATKPLDAKKDGDAIA